MSYQTKSGQLWDTVIADASLNPVLDGQNIPGHGSKIPDDWLSDLPNQIKQNFYNFYNRVKVSASNTLTLTYTGATLLIKNQIISLPPGSIQATPNVTEFVFINALGAVSTGLTLPNTCIPLAIATASANAVEQLIDLRDKVLEIVAPISLPPTSSAFATGDLKNTMSSSVQDGWLTCDGSLYLISTFPDLAALIGTKSLLPGDPANSFRVPDFREKIAIGFTPTIPIGSVVGQNYQTLSNSSIPAHTHSVNDPLHNHFLADYAHNHGINDPGHNHPVYDPGHAHNTSFPMGGKGDDVGYIFTNNSPQNGLDFYHLVTSNGAVTGVSLGQVSSNVSANPSQANIALSGAKSGVTVNPTGSGSQVDMRQSSIAVRVLIKT